MYEQHWFGDQLRVSEFWSRAGKVEMKRAWLRFEDIARGIFRTYRGSSGSLEDMRTALFLLDDALAACTGRGNELEGRPEWKPEGGSK